MSQQASGGELSHLIESMAGERQLDQSGVDPDHITPESPGVKAVRERLEEPFDYQDEPEPEIPNAEGYT